MYNLPDTIQIAGFTIKVIIQDDLIATKGISGIADYHAQEILLDPNVQPDTFAQNYWHEVIHWILYIMNEDELRKNEKFVDLMSHFLKQIIDSMRAYDYTKISTTA